MQISSCLFYFTEQLIVRFEAKNAVGDASAPSFCFGRVRGYFVFDTGKDVHYYWLDHTLSEISKYFLSLYSNSIASFFN